MVAVAVPKIPQTLGNLPGSETRRREPQFSFVRDDAVVQNENSSRAESAQVRDHVVPGFNHVQGS